MIQAITYYYEFTELIRNMNFTLKWSERVAYKLILMQWTNFHNTLLNILIV